MARGSGIDRLYHVEESRGLSHAKLCACIFEFAYSDLLQHQDAIFVNQSVDSRVESETRVVVDLPFRSLVETVGVLASIEVAKHEIYQVWIVVVNWYDTSKSLFSVK